MSDEIGEPNDWDSSHFKKEKMEYLNILIHIENRLKDEKSVKIRRSLMKCKKRIELWMQMLDGDLDATLKLSVERGLMSKECVHQLKKEAEQTEN